MEILHTQTSKYHLSPPAPGSINQSSGCKLLDRQKQSEWLEVTEHCVSQGQALAFQLNIIMVNNRGVYIKINLKSDDLHVCYKV